MVMRTELADTLMALAEALIAPVANGIVVTDAEVEMPLEVIAATRGGQLVFFGSAPHTRWRTGVLPEVHVVKLHVVEA
jgi:hypothetical protein